MYTFQERHRLSSYYLFRHMVIIMLDCECLSFASYCGLNQCVHVWVRFKCDGRRHHVMVNANTGHDCDVFIFLPTSSLERHTHMHTHAALTWECSFRLNQRHACHISCKKRSSLSCDLSPPLLNSSSALLVLYSRFCPSFLVFSALPCPCIPLPFLSAFLSPLLCIPPLPLVFKRFNVV